MKELNVVTAIIFEDEKVLTTKRGHGEFINLWEFPGGKIEECESKQEALGVICHYIIWILKKL